MGLSSKQVISSDGQDWSQTLLQAQTLELPKPPNNLARRQQNQQNQQQLEPLKCPRCDSINTKFCYYNNYSKSQPRHFCKACKRHWTKGGTLRNVPLGGGRKNKRPKTSSKATNNNSTTSAAATTTTPPSNNTRSIINRVNPQLAIQAQHLGIGGDDQKNTSNIFYRALIGQPSSAIQQDSINLDNTTSINGVFLGSSLSLPQSQSLNFPYPLSSSFDTNPCSTNPTSFKSSVPYSYSAGEAMEDSIITTIMPSTSSSITHTWQVANTSNGMEGWNWDDLENFVSTDLNISWDDPDQIKP